MGEYLVFSQILILSPAGHNVDTYHGEVDDDDSLLLTLSIGQYWGRVLGARQVIVGQTKC